MAFHGIDTDPAQSHGHGNRGEYGLYYGLIFMVALPFEFILWSRALVRSGKAPNPGLFARARSRAMIITPIIFSV